jgi:hypothetical protein
MRLMDAETAWALWLLALPLLAGAPAWRALLLALGMAVVGVAIRFYRLLSGACGCSHHTRCTWAVHATALFTRDCSLHTRLLFSHTCVGAAASVAGPLAGSKRKPVLHSIVYSHFVERVRWAMDRLHYQREERPDVGILGLLLKGRTVPVLEVPATHSVHGSSDAILRYLWAEAQG